MAIIVEAIYEDGVLKLSGPLPFAEHEKVEVIVRSKGSRAEAAGVVSRQDAALIEWAAMSPELEYPAAEEAE